MQTTNFTDDHWNSDLADAAHLDNLSMEDVLHSPIKVHSRSFYGISPDQEIKAKTQDLRRSILRLVEGRNPKARELLAGRIIGAVADHGGWQSFLEPLMPKGRAIQEGHIQLYQISNKIQRFLANLEEAG